MTPTELLAAFRDELVDDDAQAYLWSDAAVLRYMNDAQRMFCRLTEGVEDSTAPDVCQLSVVPGTEWYTLSPLILKIRSAHRDDTGRDVQLVAAEHADSRGIRFDGSQGPLKALVSGLTKGKLRAWPLPNETITVTLSVFRMPLETITADNIGDAEFEIDEQHHEALLMWMKHRAYGKHDSEAFDKRRADEFEQRFINYCEQAKREQTRMRRPVGTVSYGGI